MANSVFLWWGTGQVIVGPITIQGNVLPSADNTYDLGSSSLQWRTGYFGTSVKTPLALVGDGTAAAPSVAFASTTNTGLWYASSAIRASIGGTEVLRINSTDIWADTNSSNFRLGSSGDVNMKWIAAGQLGLQNDSTHGVTLDVGTDAFLKVFARNGSTFATVKALVFETTSGVSLGTTNTILWNAYGTNFYSDLNGRLVFRDNAGTAGVALNFATDSTLKVFARDGSSSAALEVSAYVWAKSFSYVGAAASTSRIGSIADGKPSFANNAGSNGFVIDAATASGTAAFLSLAGADTATIKANKAQITGLGAFASGDKYVVVDSSGNLHVSALGPAS